MSKKRCFKPCARFEHESGTWMGDCIHDQPHRSGICTHPDGPLSVDRACIATLEADNKRLRGELHDVTADNEVWEQQCDRHVAKLATAEALIEAVRGWVQNYRQGGGGIQADRKNANILRREVGLPEDDGFAHCEKCDARMVMDQDENICPNPACPQALTACKGCDGTGYDTSVKNDGPERYSCPVCRPGDNQGSAYCKPQKESEKS